ncbi:hypothetical protein HKD37_12G034284 [Glycine soja]
MYFKTAKLFTVRGRQTQAMINSGSQYYEVVSEAMNSGQQELNTHCKRIKAQPHIYCNIDPISTSNTQSTWKAKHLQCSHAL